MLGALSVLEKKLRFQVAFVLTVIPRLPDRYRIVRPADGARIVEFSDRVKRGYWNKSRVQVGPGDRSTSIHKSFPVAINRSY